MKKDKDVYLPFKVCLYGIGFIAVGIGSIYVSFTEKPIFMLCAIAFIGFGLSAILCWKNQWIKMINSREFIYSTMFGNKRTYKFSDITKATRNVNMGKFITSNITININNKKVYIDGEAIVSRRFAEIINKTAGKYVLYHTVKK